MIFFSILILSITITSLIFWSVMIIQDDAIINSNSFYKDLSGLFTSQIVSTVNLNNDYELFSILEKIYLSTGNIRYIFLFRPDGSLLYSLPTYYNAIHNLLYIPSNFYSIHLKDHIFDIALVINQKLLDHNIANIVIPIIYNGHKLGHIELGINARNSNMYSSIFIYIITIFVFISIWLIVIIVSFVNSLSIVYPLQELLLGIQNISAGNFNQKICYHPHSQFADLIIGFNEMAEKLAFYEKTNIEKLIVEKHKLESVVSTIADGTILIDLDLRLLFVNQVAIKAFKWENLDIIGKFIGSYLPSHVNQSLLPIFNNLVKRNCFEILNSPTEEICMHLDYGNQKVFRFILTALLDTQTSMLTSIVIIMQDISREVQLNEAKNQFIGNVSHELRTPLCNIGSFLETLLDYSDSLTLEQKQDFLSIANNETKRLGNLVNDILDLSRLESDVDYSLLSVNIVDILYSIINTSQLTAQNNQIYISLEIDPSIKYVLGHESLLFQVISNLVSNAIKFSNIYGKVILRAYIMNSIPLSIFSQFINQSFVNLIRIEVIDEGLGIDRVDQKIIFDRFVRIEDDVHTLQGTGLGLSIVKNILLKHKSFPIVQSEPSVGTSFYFDLFEFK
uniref:Uncharacterized sensor-like histidine kinase ycf26 n=1 Tax=Anotrichium furcellatum TaxID=41999 RepID=A0A4D6WKZ4_9FLOR|nr:Drug sensory protein A [Anotrichium furcellatum]